MTGGRTTWFPRDAAWHRRELIVELGDEFGPTAIAVLGVVDAWAQEQRAGGEVRGGFRALAREAFVVTVSHAESLVVRAGEIGVLDDLEIDPDGRRFTCRVSGWQADVERGRASLRQAARRNLDAERDEQTVTDRDVSRPVTLSTPHNIREEKTPLKPPQGGRSRRRSSRGTSAQLPPRESDPAVLAIHAEHFSDLPVASVEAAAFKLKCRSREPTVDAIRELLEPAA